MIGRALKRILGASHEVIAASTGKEALALIGSGKHFDVLLCDLMMPEMTGMDLYRVLLDQRPDDAQRMVFLSGGAFTEDARIFLDEVSNVRLEKPFDPQTLRDLIDRGPASGLLA